MAPSFRSGEEASVMETPGDEIRDERTCGNGKVYRDWKLASDGQGESRVPIKLPLSRTFLFKNKK